MPAGLNSWTGEGRLGKDPEFRVFEETGKMRVKFSIACDRYKGKDAEGNPQKHTDWFECEAWGTLADQIGSNFKKGKPIIVQGDIEFYKHTGEDQIERYYHRVNVRSWSFTVSDNEGGGGGGKQDRSPVDPKKSGGGSGKTMNAAEYKKWKEEQDKQAKQQKQDADIDALFKGEDEIPF